MKQNIINSRHKRFIGLAVLALVALLVAACSGTAQSSTQPATKSPQSLSETSPDMLPEGTSGSMMESETDRMFIDMMVPHHQSAIEMANIAKQRAEHTELKQMAEDIITEQAAEIKQLQDWRQQWFGSSDTPPMTAMPLLPGMSGMGHEPTTMDAAAEVEQLRSAAEPFDRAFIKMMIAHHEMAIDAAQMALHQATHSEIKEMAQDIIDSQQREIDQLNQWDQLWYGTTP